MSQDIDQVFSRVSEKLHIDNPKTLPHMQKIIDRLSFDKRHVMVDRVIDFKTWLANHIDHSFKDLKDSHQLRIAMKPKNPPLNWRQTRMPVIQGKQFAYSDKPYSPETGVSVLESVPSARDKPSLSEIWPLFNHSQAYEREVDADGACTRKQKLPSDEMDCAEFKSQLFKLRAAITYLHEEEDFFYCMRFEDQTSEVMKAWWKDFLDEQEAIMDNPERRSVRPLDAHSGLLRRFSDVISAACADPDRQQRWARVDAEALAARDAMLLQCQYSLENLAANYRAPCTASLQLAEHASFENMLQMYAGGRVPASGKVFLAMSTEHLEHVPSSDVFAGYMGPGSKQRSRPKLWMWVCEVQKLLWNSADWQTVRLLVHWYRPYPRCSKRWIAAFWEKGGSIENHKMVLDLPDDADPNDQAYWFMEELELPFECLLTSFDGVKKKKVIDTDEQGREKVNKDGKKKKTEAHYLPDHIQSALQERCAWLDSLAPTDAGLAKKRQRQPKQPEFMPNKRNMR